MAARSKKNARDIAFAVKDTQDVHDIMRAIVTIIEDIGADIAATNAFPEFETWRAA